MKKNLMTFLIVSVFFSMSACAAQPKTLSEVRAEQLKTVRGQIDEITPDELLQMQRSKEKFVLLDVREENERGLTIPAENEKHIPRGLLEWQADKKLDKKDKIVVYCRTGDRGAYATAQLRRMGFRNAVNLKGGIVARMEAGHPVKTFNLGEIVVRDYRFKP